MVKINARPEIMNFAISCLNPWEDNPREISEEALKGLRDSIEKFGYVDLIVVNKRNMQVISGHQRLRVLKEAGVEEIDCLAVDMDDMAQKALAVTLNNQQITGYFTQALMPILEDLRQRMPTDYLNLRLEELRESLDQLELDKTGKTLPDDIPKQPEVAVTKPGDLWILGNHRLLCGDSTNAEHVARLMDGQKAKLMSTDPPYLVDYTGKNRPNGGGKDWSDKYHEIDITDARGFFKGFLTVGLANVDPNTAIYMWHADRRLVLIYEIFNELDILMHQQIIWRKPAPVMTHSTYPWLHEPCLYGWKRGQRPFFRPHRKQIGTVWPIGLLRSGDPESPEYYCDIWEVDWEGKKRNSGLDHPTVKPTEIFAIPMRVHTKIGDICYEPFSGSGSQIIAGERVNRRVFAMEIEPGFCDVAVRRWEEFTGQKAVLSR